MTVLAGTLDTIVSFATDEPIFVGILVVLLGFVFFMYLLVRRTLVGLREGYEKGQQ